MIGISKIPHSSLMATHLWFSTCGKKQILLRLTLLNPDVGNGNIAMSDEWGILLIPILMLMDKNCLYLPIFSLDQLSSLIRTNYNGNRKITDRNHQSW